VYTLSGGGEVEVVSSFRLEPGKKSQSAFRLVCEGGELHVDSANESYPIEIRPTGKPAEGIPVPLNDALLRGLSSEWQEFLDTIDGAAPGRLRIEDARQAVLMAEKTIASAEQGGASIPLG
jgi:predicted dehydrogenase